MLNFNEGDIITFEDIPHIIPLPDFVQNVVEDFTTDINRVDEVTIESAMSQVDDCIRLISKTRNPRVFFERYDFALALLFYLSPFEGVYCVEFGGGVSPSRMVCDFVTNRELWIQEFLQRGVDDSIWNYDYLLSVNHKAYLRELATSEVIDIRETIKQLETSFAKALDEPNTVKRLNYYEEAHKLAKLLEPHHEAGALNLSVPLPWVIEVLEMKITETKAEMYKHGESRLWRFSAPQYDEVDFDKKSSIVSVFVKKWADIARREFVVLDLETTGLDKVYDGIVEIAAIKYIDGVEAEKFTTLVNPGRSIPPGAMAVHKITDDMVKSAPAIKQVMPQLLTFLGDSLLVGHNANFDIGFVEVWARRLGYNPVWNYVDTISVAKKILPGLHNYKQGTVLNAIGYTQNQYHRAEDDCRGCAEIMLLAVNSIVT